MPTLLAPVLAVPVPALPFIYRILALERQVTDAG